MKKFVRTFLILLIIIPAAGIAIWQLQKYISASSESGNMPVYFALDEGYGTTANNNGTSGSDGSISGSSWRTEDLCLSGKCLYFDGSDDVITMAATTSGVKTVSFWVRPMTTSEQFIDMNGTASISASSGTISATGFTSPTIYVNGLATSTIQANRWNHIVVTTATGISASAFKIGQISTNYGQGFFDEIQLYTSELSAAQIKSLYNSRGADLTATQVGNYDQKALSDGLVGYWKMDESSWTNNCSTNSALDSSGNGNDADACPNSTGPTGGVAGKFGNAAALDASNDYLRVPDASSLDASSQITVAAWVYVDSYSNSFPRIFSKNGAYDLHMYTDVGSQGRLEWDIRIPSETDVATTSSHVVPQSTWTHVAATYDGRSSRIYINGTMRAENSGISGTLFNSSQDLGIGGTNSGTFPFPGDIDDARIYNRALSAQEIQQLYNWAPGPIGHWKFDEASWTNNCSTDSIIDSSGNGNNGDVCPNSTGPTGGAIGKYGKSGDFDGSDDYLQIPDSNNSLDANSFTLGAWIYPDTIASGGVYDTLITRSDTGSELNGTNYYLELNDGGEMNCGFYNGSGWADHDTGTAVVSTSSWQYVTCTFDTIANTVKMYVNGIEVYSASETGNVTMANFPLCIANVCSPVSQFFDGKIDDVKVYNYARTPSQIIQDMNAGHPLIGTPVAGPVAHWKFDDNFGTTAEDSTPNNNDLTLNAASWTTNGRFNSAWSGTGSNRLTRSDDADFDFTASEDFSISMWVRSSSATNPGSTEYTLSKETGSSAGYAMYFTTDGRINFGIDDDTSWGPDTVLTPTTDYYDNAWHHIVGVKTGTSSLKLYLDGKLISESSSLPTGSLENSDSLTIGDRNTSDDSNEFTGTIDEVKIYRAALTASDVLTEFNQGKAVVVGGISTESDGTTPSNSQAREYCVPGDTTSCNAPVGHWKIDEGTGTTANDTSGNGYAASLNGGPTWGIGKFGKGIVLDGDDDHLRTDLPLSTFISASTGTISLWYKPTGSAPSATEVYNGDGIVSDNNAWFGIYRTDKSASCANGDTGDRIYFYNFDSDEDCIGTTYTTDEWMHLTWVHSSGTLYGYKNGTLIGSTASGDTGNVTFDLVFGAKNEGINGVEGTIDDIKVFNYARTPAQVAWEYNRGAPIGWWKFDEDSGTTAYDASQNGNGNSNGKTGTLTNSPTRTSSGKFNSAIDFDGSNDYVVVSDTNALDISDQISFAAWIKADSLGGVRQDIITKPSAYEFRIHTDNTIRMTLFGLTDTFVSGTGTTLSTGTWYHVAATYDGANMRTYVNGNLDVTDDSTGTITTTANNLFIGAESASTSTPFNGIIDDVRIYNYALTAKQIQLIMSDNAAGKF